MEDENNCDEEFEGLVFMSIIFKGKRPRAQKLRNSAPKIYYNYITELFYDYKQTYQETDLQIVLFGRCKWWMQVIRITIWVIIVGA